MNKPIAGKPVLRVYVATGCAASDMANERIMQLRRLLSDSLSIEVIDVHAAMKDEVPEAVFSVPTYVLDGQVVSLGNPGEDFVRRIHLYVDRLAPRDDRDGPND